jgi:hypothetical protein
MDLQNPNFWATVVDEQRDQTRAPARPAAAPRPPAATASARGPTVWPRGWENEVLAKAAARLRRFRAAVNGMHRTLSFLDRFSPRISSRAYHAADGHLSAMQILLDGLEGVLAEIAKSTNRLGSAPEQEHLDRRLDQVVGQLARLRASARSPASQEQPAQPKQPMRTNRR